MPLMTQREYAAHRKALGLPGTSHTAVQKAIESGRIKANRAGKIDSEKADAAWAGNTDGGSYRSYESNAGGAGQVAAPVASSSAGDTQATEKQAKEPAPRVVHEASPFQQARTAREISTARMAQLKLAKEQGQLVDLTTVQQACESVMTVARTKLLSLPTKIKSQMPHLTPSDIKEIDALLRGIMIEMADGVADMLAQQGKQA